MAPTRFLLADHSEPWRAVITEILQQVPGWRVVAEARDGFDLILKSRYLQPDVVLLDFGLPEITATDAMRQIRAVAPCARILLLTSIRSAKAADAGLAAAAAGCVLKFDAAVDLLPAIHAALAGKQFVSKALSESEDRSPAE